MYKFSFLLYYELISFLKISFFNFGRFTFSWVDLGCLLSLNGSSSTN